MEKIEDVIWKVKDSAKCVWDDLKGGWPESIYQKAMEIALRERGVVFESQRILPVEYREPKTKRTYNVGEGIPDIVVWVESGENRTAIVVDLKADQNIKEDHARQVQKYIESFKKQLKSNEEVYPEGIIINFTRGSGRKIPEDMIEQAGPDIFIVNETEDISARLDKEKKRGKGDED